MYLSFYKLKHKPFQISTDPRFLWLGEKHEEALATLKYGVLDNKGFLLLTGDVGTGKTTLINALLNSLDKNTFVASIRDPALDPLEFFQYTAHAFGMKASNINSKVSFLIQFEEFLLDAYKNKRKVLLIIDEAQRMNQELLEEVRLLSNIEREESKLINIFFVGQIEFNEILLQHENRAIRQRVTISYNIETLTEKETVKYIKHRLDVASIEKVISSFTPVQKMENGEYVRQGYTLPLPDTRKEIFTPKAIQEIHKYAKGYPRLINIICDRALLTGYVEGSRTITDKHMRECVQELEIPHAKQEKKPAKVSESAAVADINIFRKSKNNSKKDDNRVAQEKGQPAQVTAPPPPETKIPSHDDKSAQELLSDLEKLVLKKEKLPEQSSQQIVVDQEEPAPQKTFLNGDYRNLIYFIAALVFGVLLYISFSPTTLFNSGIQQQKGNDTKMPSAKTEEKAASTDPKMNEESQAQAVQSTNEVSTTHPKTDKNDEAEPINDKKESSQAEKAALFSPSSIPKKNNKSNENIDNGISSKNETASTGSIDQEKDDINTRIQQLKKLITFQKLTISFAPNSTLPQDESLKKLDSLIEALRTHSSFRVTVTYYINGSTEDTMPAKLIEFQAGAIKSYLMGKGLKAERITIQKRDNQSISPFKTVNNSNSPNHSVEIFVDR